MYLNKFQFLYIIICHILSLKLSSSDSVQLKFGYRLTFLINPLLNLHRKPIESLKNAYGRGLKNKRCNVSGLSFKKSFSICVPIQLNQMNHARNQVYTEKVSVMLDSVSSATSYIDILSTVSSYASLFPIPFSAAFQIVNYLSRLFTKQIRGFSILNALSSHPNQLKCLKNIFSIIHNHIKLSINLEISSKDSPSTLSKIIKPSQIEQLVTCLSKLQMGEKTPLTNFISESLHYWLEEFKTEELIAIFRASRELKPLNMRLFVEKAIQRISDEIGFQNLNNKDLLTISSSFVLIHLSTKQIDNISSSILKRVDTFTVNQCIAVIHSFSKIKLFDEILFDRLAIVIVLKSNESLHTHQIICLLKGFSHIGYKDNSLLLTLIKNIDQKFTSFSLKEISIILRSLAILNYFPEGLFNTIFGSKSWSSKLTEATCDDFSLSRFYQSYLGFITHTKKFNNIGPPQRVISMLKSAFCRSSKRCHSSSLHNLVYNIFKQEYRIPVESEFRTSDGNIIDLAILPHNLNFNDLGFMHNVNKSYAIEVQGPYHYIKRLGSNSLELNGATRFKHRLLKALNWEVVSIPYWSIIPWESLHHNSNIVKSKLPHDLLNLVTSFQSCSRIRKFDESNITDTSYKLQGHSTINDSFKILNNTFSLTMLNQSNHVDSNCTFRNDFDLKKMDNSSGNDSYLSHPLKIIEEVSQTPI